MHSWYTLITLLKVPTENKGLRRMLLKDFPFGRKTIFEIPPIRYNYGFSLLMLNYLRNITPCLIQYDMRYVKTITKG